MIRYMACIRRRQDVDVDTFRRFWNDRYTELVHAAGRELGALGCRATLSLDVAAVKDLRDSRGSEPPFDGVLEIWWLRGSILKEKSAAPRAAELIARIEQAADEYIDWGRSSLFFTELHHSQPTTS